MSSIKTLQQVRDEFARQGQTARGWAKANGFHESTVYEVLAGRKKCLRGEAHKVAVVLGLKQGVVISRGEITAGQNTISPSAHQHSTLVVGD